MSAMPEFNDLPAHEAAFKAESWNAIREFGVTIEPIGEGGNTRPNSPCFSDNHIWQLQGAGKEEALRLIEEAELSCDNDFRDFLEACIGKGFFGEAHPGSSEWEERFNRIVSVYQRSPKEREAEKLKAHALRYVRLNDFKRAINCYSKSIDLVPDGRRAHVCYANRAALYCRVENYEEALVDCTEALILNPDYAKAHSRLGFVLSHLGRLEEAVQSYEKAVELEPLDMSNYALLEDAVSLLEANIKAKEKAKAVMDEAAAKAKLRQEADDSYRQYLERMKSAESKLKEAEEKDQAKLSKAAKMLGTAGGGEMLHEQIKAEKEARDQIEAAWIKSEKHKREHELKYGGEYGEASTPERGLDNGKKGGRSSVKKRLKQSFRRGSNTNGSATSLGATDTSSRFGRTLSMKMKRKPAAPVSPAAGRSRFRGGSRTKNSPDRMPSPSPHILKAVASAAANDEVQSDAELRKSMERRAALNHEFTAAAMSQEEDEQEQEEGDKSFTSASAVDTTQQQEEDDEMEEEQGGEEEEEEGFDDMSTGEDGQKEDDEDSGSHDIVTAAVRALTDTLTKTPEQEEEGEGCTEPLETSEADVCMHRARAAVDRHIRSAATLNESVVDDLFTTLMVAGTPGTKETEVVQGEIATEYDAARQARTNAMADAMVDCYVPDIKVQKALLAEPPLTEGLAEAIKRKSVRRPSLASCRGSILAAALALGFETSKGGDDMEKERDRPGRRGSRRGSVNNEDVRDSVRAGEASEILTSVRDSIGVGISSTFEPAFALTNENNETLAQGVMLVNVGDHTHMKKAVITWITAMTGDSIAEGNDAQDSAVMSWLRNGEVLRQLTKQVNPHAPQPASAFQAANLSNIAMFTVSCKRLGIPSDMLFQPSDLLQPSEGSAEKVIQCLYLLGWVVSKFLPDFKGPTINQVSLTTQPAGATVCCSSRHKPFPPDLMLDSPGASFY
ncbi:unnamed protein product [Chrysoparadoxa australica]